ncbi:response regulator transcription factor [Sphingobacterium sp. ML3W]|uniref:response regulator transcription factor n=1 Tax=Sphingobacterium sp. ML3W TaxID=1538644 RepID=UPI00249C55F0|nr:response regulator transcription factor [Sphingobacterium sp. ML3W]WFA81193.1 response regulator transcription factor [Sphingobacterium sp. ML3W]
MIKILLVEDHMVVRNGIKLLLESQDSFEVVGEASNGKEALDYLQSNPDSVPDIILTDISMEEMDGIALLRVLYKQYGNIKVVILSMLNQINYVIEGFEYGLMGYLVKNIGYNELLFALNHIAAGGRYMSEEISMLLLEHIRSGQRYAQHPIGSRADFEISERELEVLGLIAEGYTNIEIADKIFLSKRTVEGHRQNLIDKAGVKNTAHLVKFAFENGILN